jgi:hypothetical protein
MGGNRLLVAHDKVHLPYTQGGTPFEDLMEIHLKYLSSFCDSGFQAAQTTVFTEY